MYACVAIMFVFYLICRCRLKRRITLLTAKPVYDLTREELSEIDVEDPVLFLEVCFVIMDVILYGAGSGDGGGGDDGGSPREYVGSN